ncbi:hypothetical protein FACS1894130_04230 [Spirochaetia bacterium]|nr:hypothetical protein FACS1894130_04230 [Spirochaetia bacterium]
MTSNQEDALYEFLENVTEPFTLDNVVAFVKMLAPQKSSRLGAEISALIDARNIAFRLGDKFWVSRRGCFEPVKFAVSPSRLELVNGILIPGHRCVPFANPALMPHEYVFFWHGVVVPSTSTEGSPEELYPYYSIFGEEYAPQYVAKDNPENEDAFNSDPYEDPPEVSIRTLDMRNIYRESGFVPGDRFVVTTKDWKVGEFELERVGKDEWPEAELDAWFKAAEAGFYNSFATLGPGSSTDEQIAYAYWYGGERMRQTPAYALEEFLYEKTEGIETVGYGIETRFWYAGKEIPDQRGLEGAFSVTDRTYIEDMLYQKGVPISEYVIQSYIRDALFRNDTDVVHIIERVIPHSVGMDDKCLTSIAEYVIEVLEDFSETYTLFADRAMGPIRQRVGELHTAVIDLSARLLKGDVDRSWLPKHTFVVLSQIQSHAAAAMEDLDSDEAPEDPELETMDNSLDSMIETYEDIKELIDEAMDSFRRNNISVVRGHGKTLREAGAWKTVQLGLSGTDVWRRIVIPGVRRLEELHRVIQLLFNWEGDRYQFTVVRSTRTTEGDSDRPLNLNHRLEDLSRRGVIELLYEYGTKWAVTVMFLAHHDPQPRPVRAAGPEGHSSPDEGDRVRCVAGAGAVPPPSVDGPVAFKKWLAANQRFANQSFVGQRFANQGFAPEQGKPGGDAEPNRSIKLVRTEGVGGGPGRNISLVRDDEEAGEEFNPNAFDITECNQRLDAVLLLNKQEPGPSEP